MHPSPVPKSKAIAAKKQALPRDFLADRQRDDPITALNAFARLDPAIVKYLGADRLDIEETPR